MLPGEVITASVSLEGKRTDGSSSSSSSSANATGSLGTYFMNMTRYPASGGGAPTTTTYHYTLLGGQTATESAAYFVLEHQPSSCRQLPPNNNVTWTDIAVEVNGKPVDSPVFKAVQEAPKCGSVASVDANSVTIKWEA